MKKIYEQFKADCPDLDFSKSDIIKEKLHIEDPYEIMDMGEEEVSEGLGVMRKDIESLKTVSKEIPELKYLVPILELITNKIEADDTLDVEFELDLNKLKFCKTLLAYIYEDFAERTLPILDDLQDQLVDDLNYDKNRVFYFPKEY